MKDDTEETQESNSLREDYLSFPHQLQSNETLDMKEWDEKKRRIEDEFLNFLKNINEEALQLSEFLLEENRLTREVCVHLKQILTRLNISLAIPTKAIPSLEGVKEIILNAQGHLILVGKEDEVNSKALEEFSPDMILMVVWTVIPELERSISLYRKRIGIRINFFDKINQELKNIHRAFTMSEVESETAPADALQEDGIRKVLLPKK